MDLLALSAMIARLAIIALFFDGLGPLLPEISKAFLIPDHDFQKIIGLAFIFFALSQLFSIVVIAQIGLYRSILFSSLAIVGSAIVLCLVTHTAALATSFIALFAVNGIGSNATRVALRNMTSNQEFQKYFAWANTLMQIEQIIVPGIAGSIAALYNWRLAILVLIIPVAIVGICLLFIDKKNIDQSSFQPSLFNLANIGRILQTSSLLQTPSLLSALMSSCIFHLCFSYTVNWFPFILAHQLSFPPEIVGITLSLENGVAALGCMLGGYSGIHLKENKTIRIGIVLMMGAITLIFTAQIFASHSQPHIRLWIAAILLLDLAYGFIVLPCTAIVLNIDPQHRPLASALLGFSVSITAGLSVFTISMFNIDPQQGIPYLITLAVFLMMALRIARFQR